ncbi:MULTISPECIES: DUF1786 family protein [unclassified Archaeoglobus]|jgi:uncharacterized protein (DUF1786 family)|uniref:DUF1786 family protein n=1 Tax=unclassified Archaeoglobus TaxID=2643606 RepID=UPI0025C4DA09|nr:MULTISPECIES: DUF1786 family protein [unclassified Archaeoglobus]
MLGCSVFTLDVGSGTQDFMLFAEKNIRNCPKAILPSPTKLIARRIERVDRDIYLHGYTMGGGAITWAVRRHLERYRVYADERAALTFSDDLEKVREMGVIIGEPDGDVVSIETKDVDMPFFADFISKMGYEMPEKYVIAVQDHGFSPKISNRIFRFRMFERLIKKSPAVESFLFHSSKIPAEFNRMRDAARSVLDYIEGDVYVIDTVFAAIAGCAISAREFPALLVNFGNSHLTAAVVNRDLEIRALLEHHTPVLKRRGENIEGLLERFVEGKIDNEYILKDGGHGCYIEEVLDVRDSVCTGPNAKMANIREADGDPMTVGNLGMLFLLERRNDF